MATKIYTIKLQVILRNNEDPPSTWHWPTLLNCLPDEVQVLKSRLVATVDEKGDD